MQPQPAPSLLTVQNLRRCFSGERLGAYSLNSDASSTEAVARYLWNGALAVAFHPTLHVLEVTLRNTLYCASEKHVALSGRTVIDIPCWLDVYPSYLENKERGKVDEAKLRLGHRATWKTPGHLISKLGFGFWVNLHRKAYDAGHPNGAKLWPALTPVVYRHAPNSIRHRAFIADRLEAIRDFRNRIAHHEPIWDRDVLKVHSQILETIGWMNPSMQKTVQATYDIAILWSNGHSQFLPMAKKLLGA